MTARWAWLAALLVLCTTLAAPGTLHAEYGDVILNKRSEKEGVRPVVFPHWFHRIRFRCKVCHYELGFEMRAGANDVKKADMIEGKFCGMCHNGNVAWDLQRCDLCHVGRPGLASGMVGGAQTSGPGRW